jgi:predicted esterase
MQDKSIGPLQDAQQAIRFVRQHAKEWNLDPARVGVIGFSAGDILHPPSGPISKSLTSKTLTVLICDPTT